VAAYPYVDTERSQNGVRVKAGSASGDRGAMARFINRFTLARMLLFSISLFAPLIMLQGVIASVAKRLPSPARPLWLLPTELLYSGLMLWLYCLLVRHFECREVAELAKKSSAPRVAAGIALGMASFGAVYASLAVGGYVQHAVFGGLADLLSQLATSIATAVGEELVFRGAIFRIAEERLGTAMALIISSVLFGLAHAVNPSATPVSTAAIALEAGALLGIAYSASRGLWLPIGVHFGWNFAEGGIFGTVVSGHESRGLIESQLSGPTVVTGGTFGPEAGAIALAVCLGVAVAIAIWTVRHGRWCPWSRAVREASDDRCRLRVRVSE
jgi:membrane protease YdiL (CAAX protease family)